MPHEADALVPLSDITGPEIGPVYPIAPDYQAIEDAETAATTERRGEHLGSERGRAIPAEVADEFIENHPKGNPAYRRKPRSQRRISARTRFAEEQALPDSHKPFDPNALLTDEEKATFRNGRAMLEAVQRGEIAPPPVEEPDEH